MSYTVLDDQWHSHPKLMKLGNTRDGLAATGLQSRVMSWCAGNPTDGHVPFSVDEMFAGKSAARYRGMLFAVELRERCESHENCSVVHDWLDPKYGNLPAEEAKRRRNADAERKRAARAAARGERPPSVQPDRTRTSAECPPGQDPDVQAVSERTSRAGVGDRARAGAPPTPTPVVSSSSPPSSSVMEGEDLSDPAGRIRSRRRAARLSLDGWDADSLHGLVARNADAFSGGMTENDLWRMLDVLAPLPETNSPGRVLNEHGQALARRLLAERRNAEAAARKGQDALSQIEFQQQVANKDTGTHQQRVDRISMLPLDQVNELLAQAHADLHLVHDERKAISRAVAIRACQILDEREQAA